VAPPPLFAFSNFCGNQAKLPASLNREEKCEQLKRFLSELPEFLPPAIRRWIHEELIQL
jgi:hypothetical protein